MVSLWEKKVKAGRCLSKHGIRKKMRIDTILFFIYGKIESADKIRENVNGNEKGRQAEGYQWRTHRAKTHPDDDGRELSKRTYD